MYTSFVTFLFDLFVFWFAKHKQTTLETNLSEGHMNFLIHCCVSHQVVGGRVPFLKGKFLEHPPRYTPTLGINGCADKWKQSSICQTDNNNWKQEPNMHPFSVSAGSMTSLSKLPRLCKRWKRKKALCTILQLFVWVMSNILFFGVVSIKTMARRHILFLWKQNLTRGLSRRNKAFKKKTMTNRRIVHVMR